MSTSICFSICSHRLSLKSRLFCFVSQKSIDNDNDDLFAVQIVERNNTSGTKIKHELSEDSSNESLAENNNETQTTTTTTTTTKTTQNQTIEQAQNFILNILNEAQSDAPQNTNISTENLQLPKYDIAFQETATTTGVKTHVNTMKADKSGTFTINQYVQSNTKRN